MVVPNKTLWYLFTKPAFLSTEYAKGRRASYTPPLRLFLVNQYRLLLAGRLEYIFSVHMKYCHRGHQETSDRTADLINRQIPISSSPGYVKPVCCHWRPGFLPGDSTMNSETPAVAPVALHPESHRHRASGIHQNLSPI